MTEFSAVGSLTISNKLMCGLPQQYGLGDLFAQMDVKFAILRMNPESVSVGQRNLRWPVNDDKVVGFDAGNQTADMDMGVALRANFVAVVSEAPAVAPQLFRFVDGSRPEFGALLRGQSRQRVGARRMNTRQRQQPVRLMRVGIFDEEDERLGRMLLRLHAKAAIA